MCNNFNLQKKKFLIEKKLLTVTHKTLLQFNTTFCKAFIKLNFLYNIEPYLKTDNFQNMIFVLSSFQIEATQI